MAERIEDPSTKTKQLAANLDSLELLERIDGRVYLLSPERQILFANRIAQAYLGYNPAGQICHEVLYSRDAPCEDCTMERVLGGESITVEGQDSRGRRWYQTHHRSIPLKNGSIARLTIVRDKTFEEERYRQLIENINDAVYHLDLEGRFQYISGSIQTLSGYSPSEFIGRHFSEFVHPDDLPALEQSFHGTIQGKSEPHEFRAVTSGGQIRHVRTSSRLLSQHGKPVGISGIMTDITSLRQTEEEKRAIEEQLRQSQKMEALGRLAGGVAHDFNNILFVILNQATFLRDTFTAGDPTHEQALQIEKAAERASALTRQLLAFSRRQPVQPQIIDINALLTEMEEMLRRIVGEDIVFQTVKATGLGTIKVDPGHIGQVLMNLVANARDAMPQGGKLTVETARAQVAPEEARTRLNCPPGHYVLLSVHDGGHGMRSEVLDRIFEPFFTTRPGGLSTGLGLSTVYSTVKQAGGHIEVESEEGCGTSFKVYFPSTDEPIAVRENGSKGKDASLAHQVNKVEGRIILLAEDEPAVRELVGAMLEAFGARVLVTSRASEALEKSAAHQGPINLLVTDVIMPEMSGKQLADELCAQRPEMQVLYMSGYTGDAITQQGLDRGEVCLLQKPFREADLLAKVLEALGSANVQS